MAIEFDAVGGGGNANAATLSWSHTSSGADRLGIVTFLGDLMTGADDISGVTWGGVAMTLIAKLTTHPSYSSNPRMSYLYYILGQGTGSQTVEITAGSSHFLGGLSASYTGVKQSGQPDAFTTEQSPGEDDTSLNTALTTIEANCWIIGASSGYTSSPNTNTPPFSTGDPNAERRGFEAEFGSIALFDSNGFVTAPGAYSFTIERSAAPHVGIHNIMASFAPETGAAATPRLRTSVNNLRWR